MRTMSSGQLKEGDVQHLKRFRALRYAPELPDKGWGCHPVSMALRRSPLSTKIQQNIHTVARVEHALSHKCSPAERIGQGVARFFGSVPFVVAHVFLIAGWIALNAYPPAGMRPFDPYPFGLLALVVGVEFIFLTTFVLLNQKHEMRRTEHWQHLQLQLSMLTEQEVTKTLQMVSLACRRLGLDALAADGDLAEMTRPTSVPDVANEIERARESASQSTDGKPPAR
jgi:uncharacterized membrane protein